MEKQLTIKTPGKLMVAGEFAVLEAGYSLIVMAANRFVYVSIAEAERNKLSLTDFGLKELDWSYAKGIVSVEVDDARTNFVEMAMGLTLSYLEELGVPMRNFSLSIRSELDDASGIKYGLGSSAAVVTGVVAAMLEKFQGVKPDEEVVFKIASMAHVSVQGNGSCADIAASTYGGVLHYQAFQADWLLDVLTKESSVVEIVMMDWPYLMIVKKAFPKALQLCVGWTGTAASTGSLVKQIWKLKANNQSKYEAFLAASETAVGQILQGMEQDDSEVFLKGIEANARALAQLGKDTHVDIETKQLYVLSVTARELGGAGKLSGAGGGDCGIAFVDSIENAELLEAAWDNKGIKPLQLSVSAVGSVNIEG